MRRGSGKGIIVGREGFFLLGFASLLRFIVRREDKSIKMRRKTKQNTPPIGHSYPSKKGGREGREGRKVFPPPHHSTAPTIPSRGVGIYSPVLLFTICIFVLIWFFCYELLLVWFCFSGRHVVT